MTTDENNINTCRRSFLKAAAKATLLAAGSGAFLYFPSNDNASRGLAENTLELSSEEERDNTREKDGTYKNNNHENIVVQRFQEKYEIPTAQQARKLLTAIDKETTTYLTTSAVGGSLYRSFQNENMWPERRKLWQKLVNIGAPTGLANLLSSPAKSLSAAFQDAPLTSPETLVNKYGLPDDKAVLFVENYNEHLSTSALFGAVTATLALEVGSALFKPQKAAPPPNDQKPDEPGVLYA